MPTIMNSYENMPSNFTGLPYVEFLAGLSAKRNTKRYIEIGVQNGYLLANIYAELALGIDPQFKITHNVTENKKSLILHQMTSDTFFSDPKHYQVLAGCPDLIFLDGFHTFEFLLRDLINAESMCDSKGLIFLHDCLPLNAEMAERNQSVSTELGKSSRFSGFWTGDVWKITPILQRYRPDLRLVFIDCPPTGLIGVTQLNPASRVLKENYLRIMDEFKNLPNNLEEIDKMYKSIKITSSESIIKDFDNTLYFVT